MHWGIKARKTCTRFLETQHGAACEHHAARFPRGWPQHWPQRQSITRGEGASGAGVRQCRLGWAGSRGTGRPPDRLLLVGRTRDLCVGGLAGLDSGGHSSGAAFGAPPYGADPAAGLGALLFQHLGPLALLRQPRLLPGRLLLIMMRLLLISLRRKLPVLRLHRLLWLPRREAAPGARPHRHELSWYPDGAVGWQRGQPLAGRLLRLLVTLLAQRVRHPSGYLSRRASCRRQRRAAKRSGGGGGGGGGGDGDGGGGGRRVPTRSNARIRCGHALSPAAAA